MRSSKKTLGRRGKSSLVQGLNLFDAWALYLDVLPVTSGVGGWRSRPERQPCPGPSENGSRPAVSSNQVYGTLMVLLKVMNSTFICYRELRTYFQIRDGVENGKALPPKIHHSAAGNE